MMIYSLNGKLIYSDASSAVIECGGVGYKCTVSYNTRQSLPERGSTAMLFTYLAVREDAVELFGFASAEELDAFKLLIAVNGVGPKAAVAILSELTPDKLTLAIASGDVKAITRAQGVGPKIGQRIVMELKDKVMSAISDGSKDVSSSFAPANVSDSALSEAIAALVALGYSQSEAASAVSGTDLSRPVDQIIKDALKKLF